MTEYFVNAMVWSALGLVVGFMLGMGWRVKFKPNRLTERSRERFVGALLIAIALASTAQSLVFQRHEAKVTDCQTRYNEAFQATLRERAQIADRDRRNMHALVEGVLTAKPGEGRKLLERYLDNNKKLEAERRTQRFPGTTGRECR